MKIEINSHRKIFAIQEEFKSSFPDFKLEFYKKSNTAGGPSSDNLVKSSKTLSDCRTISESGFISILPGMTVSELKQNFSNVYGLTIDVYRAESNISEDVPVSENTIIDILNK
jgi:predicted transcriptional regulator